MSTRNLNLAAAVCLAAGVAAFGQPGAGYIFQLPGQNSSSGQIYGYPYGGTPLSASISTLGPNGTYNIVPKQDGTGYYVAGTTLQIADNTFTNFSTINGIASAPTAIAPSLDGNYVVVGAGDTYIVSASTNSILLDTNTGGPVVGIAISPDSKYAYVLTNTYSASNVTQINLVTKTKGNVLQFQYGGAQSIAMSPLGLLYVGGVNRLYEINPTTLTFTTNGPTGNGTVALNATPGPLRFTPDGTTMYFVNTTDNVTGPAIYQFTLSNLASAVWPQVVETTPPLLTDVLVAGNSRIFAISPSSATLYDVATSPLSVSITSSIGSLTNQAQNIVGAAISNELPSSLYLYLLVGSSGASNLYRVTLSNNTPSSPVAASLSGGILEFVGVPPNTGAASFLTYNTTQTVAQGATSLPLVAQVLDLTGRPIFNLPVTFSAAATSGITISTPNPTTNANGWVETTIVAPKSAGTFTVTLTAGTANTSYTITVPGTGTGTGPGGVTQVFIVSGNGQLVADNTTTFENPLTVLVTDIHGKPLTGVSVSFSVTSGTGFVTNPTTVTDTNGMANSNFAGQNPLLGGPFEVDTVVASTPYGSVSFYEVEYPTNIIGSRAPAFPPQVLLLEPTAANNYTVTVAEGAVAANAAAATITVAPGQPGALTPIPDVAITIVDPNSLPVFVPSTYASCQGNNLSDNTGTAYCNVTSACGAAIGSSNAVAFAIGAQQAYPATVVVTQGQAQTLSILAGNNQTGPEGQALPSALLVSVTDACGHSITGAKVTWTVTQGSATLTNVVSTSSSAGTVSANVVFGSAAGPVVVTVSLGTTSVQTFTLTNQAVASTMTIAAGNNQNTTINTAFPTPLTVQITDANNNPVTGVTVAFAVTSGNVVLSATSATTNAQGQASVTATATQTPGTIIVTASYASVSASFTLTAAPIGPTLTVAAFQNAASFQPGLVPCGLATATGAGLATGIVGTVSGASFFGPLPYSLDIISQITVNGTPAPIYQISNVNGKQQVTFQTPCQAAPGNNGVVVITASGASTTVNNVQILAAQPGIFAYTSPDGSSAGQVISADDGSYITATNPAKRGHNYYLIATGLGQTSPALTTDSAGINGENVVDQVIVGVSNSGVPVIAAYYLPDAIGVYAVGFTIPANLTLTNAAGTDQPLALAVVINGQTIFGNGVVIPLVQ
jgi:uncharacterized protein (TIGR03437 family)